MYHLDGGAIKMTRLLNGRSGVLNPAGAGEFSPEYAHQVQNPPIQRVSGSISLG